MISLPMAKRTNKGPDYVPVFNREQCHDLVNRAMGAKTLKGAAQIILAEAERVPPTKVKPNKVKVNMPSMGWREYFYKIGNGLMEGKPGVKIFNDEGNTKLPFTAFSVLPFVTCPGMGPCQDFCYSVRAWRYAGGFARQLQNTLLMKFRRKVIEKAFLRIDKDRVFRLYVDGDFDSLQTIDFWMKMLTRRPDLKGYGYSKSWALLMEYNKSNSWPTNYWLNLSSGGRDQGITVEDMMKLPITRNQFVAVDIEYHPGTKGNPGFKRYADPIYHQLVRARAKELGYGKVFSCPGKCGECSPHGHACGNVKFKNVVIAIGVH